ncbi:MAG: MATE family efflux transporter [Haliangiales bacterium]
MPPPPEPLTRRRTLRLAVPIIFAQAATALTGVVDTAVMGLYGDKVGLAAVAVASISFSFIYWGFSFLRMATTGLTAQAQGAGDTDEARAVLIRAMLLGAAIGLALIALFIPIRWLALSAFDATAAVEHLARGYLNARIWGAPALLMSFGVTGWLLGTGRTGQLLALQVIMNGVNAILDTWFVAGLDLGAAGIGAGTAIAEWIALLAGLLIVRRALWAPSGLPAGIFDRARLKALFAANRDIMVRTFALLVCFVWFVRAGTTIDTVTVAANEVLLQFVTVSAFALDSFAFVAEKEIGEAYGARDRARLRRAVRTTSELALAVGFALALCFWLAGDAIIGHFVSDIEVRDAARRYLPYCAAVPLLGVPAWQLDGIFLGATQGRALRTSGVSNAILYIITDLILRAHYGNTGIWIAFLLMYVYRAASLAVFWPSLVRALPERRS